MPEQTKPIVEPTYVNVGGKTIKVSCSAEHCMNAFRQLMLAETYPELTKVNGDTVRRKKKARKSSD